MPVDPNDVVFLDLDGCVVDSSVAIPDAMNLALRDLGLPTVPVETIHRLIGPPLERFAPLLVDRVGGGPDLAEPFARAYLQRYEERMVEDSRLYEGIPETLQSLTERLRVVIVTLKRQRLAESLLAGLGLADQIAFVVAADGKEPTKGPLLRRAIELARPFRSVMVGDQPDDMAAAVGAQIPGLGVSWGFGAVADLVAAGATAIVGRPADLEAAIDAAWHGWHRGANG
jgi:phosphoglycolate phosphatase